MNAERILLFISAYRRASWMTPRVVEQLPEGGPGRRGGRNRQSQPRRHRPRCDGGVGRTRGAAACAGECCATTTTTAWAGSNKVAIEHGSSAGMTWLLVLHGDDQADALNIVGPPRRDEHRELDALLGARFQRGARLSGYLCVRTIGNHAYNLLFSLSSAQALPRSGLRSEPVQAAVLRRRHLPALRRRPDVQLPPVAPHGPGPVVVWRFCPILLRE